VRITRIYEGTSEIMEMTIARDRWQQPPQDSRSAYYHEQARKLEALHSEAPEAGANIAALALHTLADILERARVQRLTRNQHVLFRIGELTAHAEGAAVLAERAIRYAKGKLNEKADMRFSPQVFAAISRIYAREVAMRVAQDGMRWICSADGLASGETATFASSLNLNAIYEAQAGAIKDMDFVADAIYDRLAEAQ
jgi:alkylation response protein AidB-like acyl-CoA dehydrogenase